MFCRSPVCDWTWGGIRHCDRLCTAVCGGLVYEKVRLSINALLYVMVTGMKK